MSGDLVVLITGASCGIGLETARSLASNPDYGKILLACRNLKKTEIALSSFDPEARKKCFLFPLDLSSLVSVEECVLLILKENVRINRLVLNAGVNDYTNSQCRTTIDGFDEIWQVNYLSHFYLVLLLWDIVDRVVALSSFMHWFGSPERFIELARPTWINKYDYYSNSKLAMAVFAHELNKRGKEAVAVNPGAVGSDIFRTWDKWVKVCLRTTLLTCSDGCKTSVYACTRESGGFEYLSPYGQISNWGNFFACISDMYWFHVAKDEKNFIGKCSSIVMSEVPGRVLWNSSIKALCESSKERQYLEKWLYVEIFCVYSIIMCIFLSIHLYTR